MARILVIEDNETLCRGIAMMLSTRGHQAAEAPDAHVGATQARLLSPELIIMDVQMPAGGAPMLLQTLDAQPQMAKIPIIFISGMPAASLRQWFPDTPTRRTHSKPIDWDKLWSQIEELLPKSK